MVGGGPSSRRLADVRSDDTTDVPSALVTGAGRGLGAAIARRLGPDHRVLVGARSTEAATAIAAQLPHAQPWVVDLTDHEAVAAALDPIDRLDVLVHNAGALHMGSIAQTTTADWRNTFEVNVFAVAALTRLALPALRRAGGHVVLINSGAGRRANPNWASYAASKFALRGFAEALAAEEPDIRVTSIFPGRIDTDMQRSVVAFEEREYRPDEFLSVETVAGAVRSVIDTPADALPVEVVLRPTGRRRT